MLKWTFDPTNYSKEDFELIPEGDYRVRIDDAVEETSKSGKSMIKLTLSVNGFASKLFNWIVLDAERPQYTNQRLGRIYDSFQIEQGSLELSKWKGKVGGASVKHEKYTNSEGREKLRANVTKFLIREDVEALAAWQGKGTMVDPDEKLPF